MTDKPTPTDAEILDAAEHYRNAIASACEGWTMPDGLRKHLETALYTAQPPTHALAGAVPLTPEQIERDRPMMVEPAAYAAGVRYAEKHHGIKGGQHVE